MPKSRGPDAPQRRHERRATSRRVVIHYHSPDGEAALRATLTDVSQSGVGLVLDRPLDAGRTFGLDLTKADGTTTRLLYTVIHCRPCGEKMFKVGAELTCRQDARPPKEPGSSLPAEPDPPRR